MMFVYACMALLCVALTGINAAAGYWPLAAGASLAAAIFGATFGMRLVVDMYREGRS